MTIALTASDIEMVCEQAERFGRGEVFPLVACHEKTITNEQLESLVLKALQTGFIAELEPSGMGLWEQQEQPPLISVKLLSILSEFNSGAALQFHLFALARYLLHSLSLSSDVTESTALALHGCYGLGRDALPTFLLGRKLSPSQFDFLQNWFLGGDSLPVVFYGHSNWKKLLYPSLDDSGKLLFKMIDREQLTVESLHHSHGFSELNAFRCGSLAGVNGSSIYLLENDRKLYNQLLQYNGLGLMAIALGGLRRSWKIASEYAAIREQGGEKINRHAAVQLLLGKVIAAMESASSELEHFASQPVSEQRLPQLFAIRSRFHPQICDAANACMQVMGGIGYMQDTGVEKVIRDCNALRVMAGTPTDLCLFVAEWERIYGQ